MKATESSLFGMELASAAARAMRKSSVDLFIEWMLRSVIGTMVDSAGRMAYLRAENGSFLFTKGLGERLPFLASPANLSREEISLLRNKGLAWNREWGLLLALRDAEGPVEGILALDLPPPANGETYRELAAWFYENLKTRQELRDMEERARNDDLTGLPRYRACREQLVSGVQALKNGDYERLTVAVIDLDHFKGINDAHGHRVGDKVLEHVAKVFKRSGLWVGRYGGEEFLVVQPGKDGEIRQRLEALRTDVAESCHRVFDEFSVTCSAGRFCLKRGTVQCLPTKLGWDTRRISEWAFSVADRRLYKAKNDGRNRMVG